MYFSFPHLVHDLSIVRRAFSLPVLEPLNSERLEVVTDVTLGCLLSAIHVVGAQSLTSLTPTPAGVGVAERSGGAGLQGGAGGGKAGGGSPRDEETEAAASNIIEMALEIYNIISNTVRISTRAGGHVSIKKTTAGKKFEEDMAPLSQGATYRV